MAASPPPPHPWPAHRRFYIEYQYLDILGHLNHAAYLRFVETLRCDYYIPILGPTNPSQLDIIIAEATCRYLAPVAYGETLIGEIAPARPLGRTSFSLLYRFFRDDHKTVTARGRTVVVLYDYSRASKKPIPDDRRAILERDAVDPSTEGW
ncbi:MAG: acyl-CoA thioesterase [Thermoplasmata archaeon]